MDDGPDRGMFFGGRKKNSVSCRFIPAMNAQQQRIAYMIDHLLPEIAGEMDRRKKTLLTAREMAALLERDYCRMKGKAFGRAFPEYIGKSRKLFDGIGDAGEW